MYGEERRGEERRGGKGGESYTRLKRAEENAGEQIVHSKILVFISLCEDPFGFICTLVRVKLTQCLTVQ